MQIRNSEANQQFTSWLCQMSYLPQYQGAITLPTYISICTTTDELCTHVFPITLFHTAQQNPTPFTHRVIFAMRNDTIDAINQKVLHDIPGTECEYYSMVQAEFAGPESGENQLAVEYLLSLIPASLLPSKLKLKVGALVILLRNLYPKDGLCNGTQMTVIRMQRSCIEVEILEGTFDRTGKILPRIKLSTTELELLFIFIHKQFPICLSFGITVNKARGQLLDIVGIDLGESVFIHDQLYVALLPATTVQGLKVLQLAVHNRPTQNIVYSEVLIQGMLYSYNILYSIIYNLLTILLNLI